ncbi:RNB domain-containing ribonuclease, partial [Oleiphilus sp. HI0079]|uniref:RNB domain-containing ribonuclease n=2 Tax=Oleiphilus TaxID=141450 RepID=UPI000AB19CAF
VLGNESSKGIEWVYSLAKHHIAESWSASAETALTDLDEGRVESLCSEREDLSDVPFFTVDGERTRDMDDALYIARDGSGWLLSVAIADPEALISSEPELEKEVLERSASLYAPGKIVPMLPEKLSSDLCSLVEGKKRLAKVFKIQVSETGELTDFTISQAAITSAQKLSYAQASGVESTELKSVVAEQLPLLQSLSEKMLEWRRENACVQQGRTEFYLELNDKQKIEAIKPRETHTAHAWVEECMLLVNR